MLAPGRRIGAVLDLYDALLTPDGVELTHPGPGLLGWRHARRGTARDQDDPIVMLDGAGSTRPGPGLLRWCRAR